MGRTAIRSTRRASARIPIIRPKVAILVQTITSEFLKWTGRCCLYPFACSVVLQLLAGNCLPYHQPKCPATKDPKKALGPSRFLITSLCGGFRLHFSLAVLKLDAGYPESQK